MSTVKHRCPRDSMTVPTAWACGDCYAISAIHTLSCLTDLLLQAITLLTRILQLDMQLIHLFLHSCQRGAILRNQAAHVSDGLVMPADVVQHLPLCLHEGPASMDTQCMQHVLLLRHQRRPPSLTSPAVVDCEKHVAVKTQVSQLPRSITGSCTVQSLSGSALETLQRQVRSHI